MKDVPYALMCVCVCVCRCECQLEGGDYYTIEQKGLSLVSHVRFTLLYNDDDDGQRRRGTEKAVS